MVSYKKYHHIHPNLEFPHHTYKDMDYIEKV